MLAIFVCGDLFGFVGMLIGVPTFSVLYALLKMFTAKRLKAKDIDDAQILSVQTFPDVLGKRPPKTIVIKEKKKGVPPARIRKGRGEKLSIVAGDVTCNKTIPFIVFLKMRKK